MKNSTITNFSYNSPIKPSKEDCLLHNNNQNQEGTKNISMTPIIKSDYNKNGESLTDSKSQKFEEQFKTQKIQINTKQNSLCQDDDAAAINHGLLRHTNISEAILLSQGQNQSLQAKYQSGFVTESPFKSRTKKASQNVHVSCLPNIFQDQEEYNFMRQQQQAIVEGLAIDSKLHPNGSINKNYQSSRINQQGQINEYSKKKNQIRIRSSQNQDSQKYMMGEDQIIGNKHIHYRVERQAKSNDQRHANSIKKAIRVQLSKNPALAASLEIYTNGNQQSLQYISKGVQPYVINQFLQKRKNLLQKKVSVHNNSVNNRRGQNNSLQYRNDAINVNTKNNNKNYNNNSFNCFLNKSQILDENQANNTTNYSQTQKLAQNKYQNQVKQNNIQANNIVINNQTNTTNLNALLSEYRNNSGQQRLLLQDFYNQQGIKDPEFSQKQQSLIDQYNYSKQTLNEKAQSDSPKKLTPQNANNQSFAIAQSVKEIKNDHHKTIEKECNNNDRYEESLSNISYVQNLMDNAYGGFQESDINGLSNNSFLTQSITSNRKLNNNQNSKASLKQKNANSLSKEATENTNPEFYEEDQTRSQKEQNQIMSSNTTGQNIQSHTSNVNGSPKSKRNVNSNNQTSPVIDFQNIQNSVNNKSADRTLSPIKNTIGDKNQSSLIQQRIVLQQQKRRGNSFNYTKGGTFSIAGSGDASFDLNLVAQEKNTNNNQNNNQRQFDFYENKSYYQQNMFSPPRIHKTKAVYVHSNTMSNYVDKSKLNNLEEYNFLNEDQSEKRSQSNPRTVISSFQNDQVLLIKSQVPEQQQQQQQNLEIKSNIITSVYTILQKQPDGIYTCYFQKGNNSGLVRRVLLTRSNWRESPVYSSNLNFRWHPFSKGIKFESLSLHKKRIVNHFEFHAEITTKNGIIKNIGRYCSERGLNIFDFTPTTFLFSLKEKFWDLDLIRFCDFFYKNLPEPLKNQNEYKKNFMEIKSKFRQIQIRTNNQKSNKKKQLGIVAPPGVDKYGEMKIHNTFLGDSQSSYIWLLKPTNLNRGRGIELFSNLFQLEMLLNNYFDGFYEQPIQCKAQPSDDKQTLQQQQDMLLDIAMAESIANQENQQKNDQKEKEEPVLKNLFDKSLYVIPNNLEKEEEKGKKVDEMKKISNQNNSNNNDFQDKYLIVKNNDTRNEKDVELIPNLQQAGTYNQTEQQENEQLREQQESPKKNEDGETENKTKKQKIKKNKASNSNHNVNYNNNIHISRLRDLSLPKKPPLIATAATNSNTNGNSSNNQNKQPNSPEKKNNKNSNGISSEFGGYLMKEHSFVIQKYIEKPFLINERKFDIRMWVLVNQNLDVYLFKEGYIRTSSKKYDVSDQDNIFIHLTNNAIQKYSDSYGQYENGNQLSLDNFDEYLKLKGYKQTFRGDIMPRIKEIITISMLSVKNKLNANDRKYSFELFGYDFFIDQQFNVWLIEINTNPCIEESSPLLEMLIPRMIDDALKLSVDLIFPPQYPDDIIQKQIQKYSQNSKEKKNQNIENYPFSQQVGQDNSNFSHNSKKGLIESLFPVTGYSSQENMFQFLVNLYKSN